MTLETEGRVRKSDEPWLTDENLVLWKRNGLVPACSKRSCTLPVASHAMMHGRTNETLETKRLCLGPVVASRTTCFALVANGKRRTVYVSTWMCQQLLALPPGRTRPRGRRPRRTRPLGSNARSLHLLRPLRKDRLLGCLEASLEWWAKVRCTICNPDACELGSSSMNLTAGRNTWGRTMLTWMCLLLKRNRYGMGNRICSCQSGRGFCGRSSPD